MVVALAVLSLPFAFLIFPFLLLLSSLLLIFIFIFFLPPPSHMPQDHTGLGLKINSAR
jgi:hypothetical protein